MTSLILRLHSLQHRWNQDLLWFDRPAVIAVYAISCILVALIGSISPLKRTSSSSKDRGRIINWATSIIGNHELFIEINSLLEALSMLHGDVLSILTWWSLMKSWHIIRVVVDVRHYTSIWDTFRLALLLELLLHSLRLFMLLLAYNSSDRCSIQVVHRNCLFFSIGVSFERWTLLLWSIQVVCEVFNLSLIHRYLHSILRWLTCCNSRVGCRLSTCGWLC